MVAALLSIVLLGQLANPDFAAGLESWSPNVTQAGIAFDVTEDPRAAQIAVAPGTPAGFPLLYQDLPATHGEYFRLRCTARGQDVHGGHGAYISLEYLDAEGKRLTYDQSSGAEAEWSTLEVWGAPPAKTAKVRVSLVLNGVGTGQFRALQLERFGSPDTGAAPTEVTLRLSTVPITTLHGFGVEDDGWFFAPFNRENAGITEEDVALRERRIRTLDPDYIRMFFWYQDWNPSGDWTTFAFDSPNMQSKYQTLDLYQAQGARVNVVGVDWGMEDPHGQPEALVAAWGELLDHLIRERGYTCIREWTLTNEPDTHFVRRGASFETFVDIHRRMRAELDRRELDVVLVGSDDTNGGWPWFQRCVEDETYRESVGIFASHRYLKTDGRLLALPFYEERLATLAPYGLPLLVTEFGFQDARSSVNENPVMESYDYALWTTAFACQGLNRGVAGYSIWCLHETFYPSATPFTMYYGLWNGKSRGWSLRPVYFAWRAFTAGTEPGQPIYPVETSAPQLVEASRVGDTLFWVNQAEHPVALRGEGGRIADLRAWTEAALAEAVEDSEPIPLTAGDSLPPRSFGTARVAP